MFPATYQALCEAGYKRHIYGRCQGCMAAIEWWKTPEGRAIPMNSMTANDSPAISHFATCPNTDQFRKKLSKRKPN